VPLLGHKQCFSPGFAPHCFLQSSGTPLFQRAAKIKVMDVAFWMLSKLAHDDSEAIAK